MWYFPFPSIQLPWEIATDPFEKAREIVTLHSCSIAESFLKGEQHILQSKDFRSLNASPVLGDDL